MHLAKVFFKAEPVFRCLSIETCESYVFCLEMAVDSKFHTFMFICSLILVKDQNVQMMIFIPCAVFFALLGLI